MLGFSAVSEAPVSYVAAAPAPAAVPTVTGVTVSPSGAVVDGATQQFTWVVAGANNPSQAVTLATTLGSISAGGLLTRPAKTSAVQTGTVTATSTLDPTKSGSASFTVPAASVVEPPPVDPQPVDPAPRYARPLADIAAGPWLPSSGSSLAAMIDEETPDGSDFIYTSAPGAAEIRLGPVVDPQTSSGQVLRYKISSPTGSAVTVKLKQGATVIAQWSHDHAPLTPTVFAQILSAAQCDSISDYTDLRFEIAAA